jgi:hypothetical protein
MDVKRAIAKNKLIGGKGNRMAAVGRSLPCLKGGAAKELAGRVSRGEVRLKPCAGAEGWQAAMNVRASVLAVHALDEAGVGLGPDDRFGEDVLLVVARDVRKEEREIRKQEVVLILWQRARGNTRPKFSTEPGTVSCKSDASTRNVPN